MEKPWNSPAKVNWCRGEGKRRRVIEYETIWRVVTCWKELWCGAKIVLCHDECVPPSCHHLKNFNTKALFTGSVSQKSCRHLIQRGVYSACVTALRTEFWGPVRFLLYITFLLDGGQLSSCACLWSDIIDAFYCTLFIWNVWWTPSEKLHSAGRQG